MSDGHSLLRRLSDEIVVLQKPIRILKAINWDPKVHQRFLAKGGREMPKVEYLPLGFDPKATGAAFRALRHRIRGKNPVEGLLRRKCEEFELIVQMLAARGTKHFSEAAARLYGDPRDRYRFHGTVDNLEVARFWASRPPARFEQASIDSAGAVKIIEELLAPVFGDLVKVRESGRLTANAAAGATSVAIRKGALFTQKQVRALANHEGLWHVLTSLNGYRQPVLTVLGVGLPRFTECQEGGGIVSEYLTGNITDDRYIELGERTLAVDLAARGADYLQVFAYLSARFPPARAAQMCERVFRGGVLTGGAPFTKDAAYQRGYFRVFNFIRLALSQPDVRMLEAFLCGKMDVDDVPLVRALLDEGLCVGPCFLPEWFQDLDRLMALVTHSVTGNRFDMKRAGRHWERARLSMAQRG